MAKDDKTHLYVMVAVILIAVAIAVYLLLQKKAQAGSVPPLDPDPDTPPGYQTLKFDHTASGFSSFIWNLNGEYNATLLFGNLRLGGKIWTKLRIRVKSEGSWKEVGYVDGWPKGQFIPFEIPLSMKITMVKWEAEQGLITPRYVDEVHAQLMVEV